MSWITFVLSHTGQTVLLRSLSHGIHGDSTVVSKVRAVGHGGDSQDLPGRKAASLSLYVLHSDVNTHPCCRLKERVCVC